MEDRRPQKPFPWATTIVAATIITITAFALVAYLMTARFLCIASLAVRTRRRLAGFRFRRPA